MHRVAAGNFIVNITFGWEHAVAITDKNDAGKLVSHRFPQFSFAEGMVPEFFRYVIVDEKFYRFSDYLGTTSQMSELLGISSISGILRFGRYPAYHGISEPHLAVKSSKTVVENRPYY